MKRRGRTKAAEQWQVFASDPADLRDLSTDLDADDSETPFLYVDGSSLRNSALRSLWSLLRDRAGRATLQRSARV
jgi:hypothetical protein